MMSYYDLPSLLPLNYLAMAAHQRCSFIAMTTSRESKQNASLSKPNCFYHLLPLMLSKLSALLTRCWVSKSELDECEMVEGCRKPLWLRWNLVIRLLNLKSFFLKISWKWNLAVWLVIRLVWKPTFINTFNVLFPVLHNIKSHLCTTREFTHR